MSFFVNMVMCEEQTNPVLIREKQPLEITVILLYLGKIFSISTVLNK